MPRDADAYRRELDLIFQEISDRESLASKSELLSKLTDHGIDVPDLQGILRRVGRQKGKSKEELQAWVERRLARLLRALED